MNTTHRRQGSAAAGARGAAPAAALLLWAFLAAVPGAAAAPAERLVYQGRLQESGLPAEGTKTVQFYLCDAATGGNCFGTGEQAVAVSNGLLRSTFTVPAGVDLLGGSDWHLELRLDPGGTTTLAPRERLGSAPYALVASSAAGLAARAGDPGVRVSSSLYIAAGGRLGVGTESPAVALEVVGGISASGRILGGCASDMVAVGPWCVDKYEASVWDSASCTGTQYGVNGAGNDDYPAGCNDNGDGCVGLIFACSLGPNTTKPSTWITWFQADLACANAGKELLPDAVWQIAALGTPDPGADNSVCNVASLGTPANTGTLSTCVSKRGVFDMAGNVWEWTADWMLAGTNYTNSGADGTQYNNWPAGYGGDRTFNVGGRAFNGSVWANGVPAAVLRGGAWGDGAGAGVFAFSASDGPSLWLTNVGFRCGRRR